MSRISRVIGIFSRKILRLFRVRRGLESGFFCNLFGGLRFGRLGIYFEIYLFCERLLILLLLWLPFLLLLLLFIIIVCFHCFLFLTTLIRLLCLLLKSSYDIVTNIVVIVISITITLLAGLAYASGSFPTASNKVSESELRRTTVALDLIKNLAD